jgi:tetratricopeptide (TPR) repeat protein
VMARDRSHPGANHYYIHAVEASPHPEKAIPAAERVGTMMPAAGHLVHMPAHIMQRVGRYEEAAEANRRAAVADVAYYARTPALDYYPLVYSTHNYQFLASAAAMEGRSAETLEAMRRARAVVSDKMLLGMPGADWSIAFLYEGMIRFGRWEAILREPPPDPELRGLLIGYLGAKATALAATRRLAEAKAAVVALDKVIASAPPDGLAGMNAATPLFRIASLRAKARVATAERTPSVAIALLREAVSEEDGLSYNEPADEFFPTRHLLGATLLDAGMAREAETVYREDLRRNPRNGWALYGLAKSLEAQGNAQAARETRAQFELAWKHSDTRIRASAF